MAILGQFRGDTLANWNSANPIIHDREFILISETANGPWTSYKIGDGVHHFKELPYASNVSILQHLGDSATAVVSQKLLTDIVKSGYQFKGIATSTTTPQSSDVPQFYLAEGGIAYPNFGATTALANGLWVFLSVNGTAWTKVNAVKFATELGNSDSMAVTQALLKRTIDTGAVFQGFVATDSAIPAGETGINKRFVIATAKGNYANFRVNIAEDGVHFIATNDGGRTWTLVTLIKLYHELGENTDGSVDQKVLSLELSKAITTDDISGVEGDSPTLIMSQQAITESLNKRISTESITQEFGDSTTKVVSQKLFSDKVSTGNFVEHTNINEAILELYILGKQEIFIQRLDTTNRVLLTFISSTGEVIATLNSSDKILGKPYPIYFTNGEPFGFVVFGKEFSLSGVKAKITEKAFNIKFSPTIFSELASKIMRLSE